MPSLTEIDRRHAVYYESMMGAIFEMYKFSGIMGVGLFDLYRENVLKAWSWAISQSNHHMDAARLCILFPLERTELFSLRLEPAQLVSRLESSLACARLAGDRQSSGRLLREMGDVHALNGDAKQSLTCYMQSEGLCREAGDQEGEAMSLSGQGKAHTQLHDLTAAIQCLECSLSIFQEITIADGEADALSSLAAAHLLSGFAEQAVRFYEQSLEIYRRIDNYKGEAIALCGLGEARLAVGQVNEAEKLFDEALVLFRQLLDRHGETRVLSSMSNVKENIFAGRIIRGGQDVQQA
jgi:tetratricopeptide (TPR) repeat protein